ncbi:MAG: ABC transporter ATP-binding protein [Betaproteobacteria bacterium]|nr:ABC transporter ATP-binding protein [Betaproteobacteria bacterium]
MNAPARITTGELIRVEGVGKTYQLGKTEVDALQDVSLTIHGGEFTALMGPSGSGKSTLLNICGLIDRPTRGGCRIDGLDTSSLSEDELTLMRREKIGFVFQGFNLVPVMSVRDNVEFPLMVAGVPAKRSKAAVESVLDQVGLRDMAKRLPDELSGGQRQRVAIARALVGTPRLVIADEPTANLDGDTAAHIIDMMQALGRSRGVTFLIATHDSRMVNRCDRVVALSDGRLQ